MPECPICGRPVPPIDGPGRPRTYCTPACRRAAEFELRSVGRHLDWLRRELVKARLTADRYPAPVNSRAVELLEAELAAATARLVDLSADDSEAPTT